MLAQTNVEKGITFGTNPQSSIPTGSTFAKNSEAELYHVKEWD